MLHLIDRRPSSRGRSAVNRERFLRRYKSHIQDAVKKMVGERRLADMEHGGEVHVPKKDISEPSFGFGHGGDREFVLPGNREFVAGDRIARPQGGGSGGDGGTSEAETRPMRRHEPKVGRNDPCPCGSGKKYKKCHGAAA